MGAIDQNTVTLVGPPTQSRKGLFDRTLVVLPTIVQTILIQLMLTPICLQLVDPAEDDDQAGVPQPRLTREC